MIKLILAIVLDFTAPINLPDSTCAENLSYPVDSSIAGVNLYVSPRYTNGVFTFLRMHTLTAGQPDTFIVVNDSPGYTYALEMFDYANNKSCRDYITVGIPPVSVNEDYDDCDEANKQLYDLSGRKVNRPYATGIYFTKSKRIRVIR